MSVAIRLTRAGARHRPFYRVVVTDSRMPRDGRFIATLGTYDPLAESGNIKIDLERAKEWMAKGALPSETVVHLLKRVGFKIETPAATKKTAKPMSLDTLRAEGAEPSEGEASEAKPPRKKAASRRAKPAGKRAPKKSKSG